MTKSKIETIGSKELLDKLSAKPNKALVTNLLERLATHDGRVNVKYRGWKKLFFGARKLNLDNIADAVHLLIESKTDKNFVPHLLQSGFLSELSQMKLKKNKHISSLLMSLPYVPELLMSYGVDELALNRAMFMLEANPTIADKIGNSIADVIQAPNPTPENQALLLTKLVDNVLDATAQNETSHITSAKFIQEFLIKLCNHKLPKNHKYIEELDELINDTQTSKKQVEDYNKVKKDHTSKYSLMDTLRYNFRDYIGIINDLNEKHFLVALTGKDPQNTVLLKELNSAFMQFSFNSNDQELAIDNLKDFVMAAVNLSTEEDAAKALKPLITKDLLVKIFDLPGAAGISQYKNLVLNIADDIDKFQDLAGATLARKEKLRPAIKDLLDFIYMPEENAEEKNKAWEKSLFSIVDLAAEGKVITKLIPLVNETLIKDVFSTIAADSSTAVTTEKHGLVNTIANTAIEVMQNPKVQEHVSKAERMSITAMLKTITGNQSITTISSSEISFATKLSAYLIRKLPGEETKSAIEKNKGKLAIVIDSTINQLSHLSPVLKKCELNGENILKFLPSLCNKKTFESIAKCIEKPNALNISSLLLTEPKIIPYALGTITTFCKNYLKDVIYTKKPNVEKEVDSKTMSDMLKDSDLKIYSTTSAAWKTVDIEAMGNRVKGMISKSSPEPITEVDPSKVIIKTEKVTPQGFVAKDKVHTHTRRPIDSLTISTKPKRTM